MNRAASHPAESFADSATSRRGVSVLEVVVTSVLLGVTLAMLAPMVGRLTASRQAVDQQQWATAELNNVLEDYSGRPYSEVTPESAARVALSPAAAQRLENGKLTLDVTDLENATGRKLTAEIRWTLPSGGEKVLSLTTWVYREDR